MIFNWLPKNQISSVDYVDYIKNEALFVKPIQSLVQIERNAGTFNQEYDYNYKILIVDDQSFNIEALKIILHYCIGLNTQLYCNSALSGQQAFQMVIDDFEEGNKRETSYNLILMDLNMPEMDGNTSMVNIREYLLSKKAKQPIISAVTGHLESSYVDQAINMGMN